MANVEIIIKSIDQSGPGIRQVNDSLKGIGKTSAEMGKALKMSFTEMNSAAQLAAQGIQKLKQAYQFAKEGAQIEFLQGKFDRLAQSIGTTSDVLLNELKTATKGTLSDMEMMASVTDLVGLGLVKTSKDAVRLSTVVAGLGMDMNQLVLTLANKTTMRFDQLGVAVTGFDDKVKALKESGMDADAAFTEAFLQQAEQQLTKVGNAADTTLGSFMKLEAQTKNFVDDLKVVTASLAGPFVDALARSGETADHYREVLQDVNPELYKQYQHLGRITPEMQKVVQEHDRLSGMARFAAQMLESENGVLKNNTDILKANADAAALNAAALEKATDVNKQFINDLEDVASVNKRYRDGLAEADAALTAGKMTAEEHAAAVAKLADEYDSASKRIVASMLEMKYMADGVFTDQEMSAYINGLEKLGIVTSEDAARTRELMVEAELLTPAFSSASKGAARFDVDLKRTEGQGQGAAESLGGVNDSLKDLANEGTKDATGALHDVNLQLNQLNGAKTSMYIDIYVRQHGKIPTNLGGTQSIGSSVQTGTGTANRASGGPLSTTGYTIVGEGATGWSPTAEVVTPWGEVIPHNEAQAMKNMGLLDGARRAALGTDDFVSPGSSATPWTPSGATPSSGFTSLPSGGGSKAGSGSGINALLGASVSASTDAAAMAGVAGVQAAQIAVMTAAAQAQISSTNETNKLLKILISKTGSANDIGRAVSESTPIYK